MVYARLGSNLAPVTSAWVSARRARSRRRRPTASPGRFRFRFRPPEAEPRPPRARAPSSSTPHSPSAPSPTRAFARRVASRASAHARSNLGPHSPLGRFAARLRAARQSRDVCANRVGSAASASACVRNSAAAASSPASAESTASPAATRASSASTLAVRASARSAVAVSIPRGPSRAPPPRGRREKKAEKMKAEPATGAKKTHPGWRWRRRRRRRVGGGGGGGGDPTPPPAVSPARAFLPSLKLRAEHLPLLFPERVQHLRVALRQRLGTHRRRRRVPRRSSLLLRLLRLLLAPSRRLPRVCPGPAPHPEVFRERAPRVAPYALRLALGPERRRAPRGPA